MRLATDHETGLNQMQAAFVRFFVETGDRLQACKDAGYAGNPYPIAWRLMRTPAIVAAIRAQTALRLQAIAPTALRVLNTIMVDEGAPKGVRVDAAKTLLDRAGFIAPKAREPDRDGDRPLNEYSVEELRRLIDDLEQQRGDEARVITSAPPAAAELKDMLA